MATGPTALSARAFAALQRLLPQHALSRAIGRLATSEQPWISRPFIRTFARIYDVDMTQAHEADLAAYDSFNAFFTRPLKPQARPLAAGDRTILCPADGAISQIGQLDGDRLLQAKGTAYSLTSLINESAPEFQGGTFATIYLAPRDYHRVHLPVSAELVRTTAIPGALFSVNARTEAAVSDLFCRNERLVCRFRIGGDTDREMLVVLVGALIVASIETVWPGPRSPYRRLEQADLALPFERGAEIGRFLLGSTVIVCFRPDQASWETHLQPGTSVTMGQSLGTLTA